MFKRCFVEKTWNIVRKGLKGLVLDIGSSDGLLVAPHEDAIGLDIKLEKSYIPLVVGDMHYLPFKGGFDTVTMCHVLEHTDKPDMLLQEIKRVLKSGGQLIIVIPNAKTYASRLLKFLVGYNGYTLHKMVQDEQGKHRLFFGFEQLKVLLEKNGLDVMGSYGSTPYLSVIERIFDYGFLRKIYWKLGDLDKKHAKDLIFIARKRDEMGCR